MMNSLKVNSVVFESYNPKQHDKQAIARLIFESDVEMNTLVYGKNPTKVITALLNTSKTYFLEEYTTLALLGDRIVGVVVAYPASKFKDIDKQAGQGMIKAMGVITFLRKMPLFMKMDKMLGGKIDEEGLYIHTICIDSEVRGQRIGTRIIEQLDKLNPRMSLYVNVNNKDAIGFYEKNGFEKKFHGTMVHKGKKYGEYLMIRG